MRHRTLPAERARPPLHEVMLSAERSLVVSGHTLNKFAIDLRVKNALGELFQRGVKVTLVMLNPHCEYSCAHERFHAKES